jgi:hypothetical protein
MNLKKELCGVREHDNNIVDRLNKYLQASLRIITEFMDMEAIASSLLY